MGGSTRTGATGLDRWISVYLCHLACAADMVVWPDRAGGVVVLLPPGHGVQNTTGHAAGLVHRAGDLAVATLLEHLRATLVAAALHPGVARVVYGGGGGHAPETGVGARES